MQDFQYEKLLREFFGKSDRKTWRDREAWMRKALYWKILSMLIFKFPMDRKIREIYVASANVDKSISPSVEDIKKLAAFGVRKIEMSKKAKTPRLRYDPASEPKDDKKPEN